MPAPGFALFPSGHQLCVLHDSVHFAATCHTGKMKHPHQGLDCTLLSPSRDQWTGIPLRLSRPFVGRVAWLILASTTVGIYAGFRRWEDSGPRARVGGYTLLDVLDIAGICLIVAFSAVGWLIYRFNHGLAPLLLGLMAMTQTLESRVEAPFWWLGALFASLWALLDSGFMLRQMLHLRALVRDLSPGTALSLTEDSRYQLRFGAGVNLMLAIAWWLLAAVLWWITLRIFNSMPGPGAADPGRSWWSDFLASAAVLASAMGCYLLLRFALGGVARSLTGVHAWQLPAGPGPVADLSPESDIEAGMIDVGRDTAEARCICLTELLQVFPDDALDIRSSPEVSANNHCPIHGIDALNAMTPEEFRRAASSTWLWDPLSKVPFSCDDPGAIPVVVGFSGAAYTGYYGTATSQGTIEFPETPDRAVERGQGEKSNEPEPAAAPSVGAVDRVDLRPAGISGHAVRYRHARAWFVPET